MKIVFAFIVVLACHMTGCACRPQPVATPSSIPKNQTVPLRFEGWDEASGTVRLRLTNYTAWSIRIAVELSGHNLLSATRHADGAEAPVRYYLDAYDPRPIMQMVRSDGVKVPPDEPEHPPVPDLHRVDFQTEWVVEPRYSLTFRVPKEHVARNVLLYVPLRYEWEGLPVEVLDGPAHRTSIRGIDLPPEVQANIP